jgi:autotransporter-associated beta strand protein
MGSSGTLQAGGGDRTLANAVVLGGSTTISGSNAFTFNGSFTSSGSNTRTLTVNNTGGATLAGNVFLSESNSLARSLTINGSSAVTINGVITNNNVGNTLASPLRYSGTSVLTLNNTNTYSGGTSINTAGGTVIANKDGALGSGNVLLSTGGVTLTLQNGALNNYIADTANLSFVNTDAINLNFSGTDTIANLFVDGVMQAAGLYGAGGTNPDSAFTGTGFLQVTGIPEPATTVLIGLGLLIGAQRLRRKTG